MTELPEHELSRNCIDPRLFALVPDQSLEESAHSMLFEAPQRRRANAKIRGIVTQAEPIDRD